MSTSERLRSGFATESQDILTIVTELMDELGGHFELESALRKLLEHAMRHLGCESGSLSLVDEKSGTYTKEIDLGIGCKQGQTFPLSEGVTGEIVRRRNVVILDEYAAVNAGHIAADDPRWHWAVIGVPIQWKGKIIGTCVIFSSAPGRVFTTADTRIAELFGRFFATAIVTCSLHVKAMERARDDAIAAERTDAARSAREAVLPHLLSALESHLDEAERVAGTNVRVRSAIESARSEATRALEAIRSPMPGRASALMESGSLQEALEDELHRIDVFSGARCEFVATGSPHHLDSEVALHVFRVAQEAISNAAVHARADRIRVGLFHGKDAVTVIVEDDGIGFDAASGHELSALPSPSGLRRMDVHARLAGGEFGIKSATGWGTRVHLTVPVTPRNATVPSKTRFTAFVAVTAPVARAGLARLLGSDDIDIVGEADSVEQLHRGCEIFRPDIVILGEEMAHGDLDELMSRLRDLDPAIGVVVFDASPTKAQIRAAVRSGVRGFLTPESRPATMREVVRAAGRGEMLTQAELVRSLVEEHTRQEGYSLTPRERQVCSLIELGKGDKEIAAALTISVKTVEKHVGSLLRKTGARNRTMLARLNIAHGLSGSGRERTSRRPAEATPRSQLGGDPVG